MVCLVKNVVVATRTVPPNIVHAKQRIHGGGRGRGALAEGPGLLGGLVYTYLSLSLPIYIKCMYICIYMHTAIANEETKGDEEEGPTKIFASLRDRLAWHNVLGLGLPASADDSRKAWLSLKGLELDFGPRAKRNASPGLKLWFI